MLVSSSRSPINIRHLDKATVSTGNDSIVSEGNLAYLWSRCKYFCPPISELDDNCSSLTTVAYRAIQDDTSAVNPGF